MEMHGDAKHSLLILIGLTTERAVGWRVAAASKGPCFLVFEEFARNPLSYPQHLLLCHMGEYKSEFEFEETGAKPAALKFFSQSPIRWRHLEGKHRAGLLFGFLGGLPAPRTR